MTESITGEISYANPGFYQIQVLGNVCPEIWDYFEGEIIRIIEKDSGQVITSLKIYVRDQAELSGLMHLLHDWQLVLLSVIMEGHIKNNAI